MKISVWFALITSVWLAPSGNAQTHLATRGTDQLVQGNTLFQMQSGVDYRVIGTPQSAGYYIETSIGPVAFPNASRFRVLQGGAFAPDTAVTLKDVEAKTGFDPGYGEGGWKATFTGQLISPQAMEHVYVAFQWYVDGEPVATNVQKVGSVKANDPFSLFFYLPLTLAQKNGTYSLHVYSGYLEIRQAEIKKGATW